MKKFFKVVTVSTMGLLFSLTNDVVAAAGGASSAETPLSKLAGLLAPALDTAFDASGKGSLPGVFSPEVLEFLGASDLAKLGRVCEATHAISVPKIQTMTVPEFRGHVITPKPFNETRALRITADSDDSQEEVEGVLRGIQHIPDHLQAIYLDFGRFRHLTPTMFPLIEAMAPRLQSLTIQGKFGGTPLPDTVLPALTNLKSLNLTWFILSEAILAQLITKIEGGLSHVNLISWNSSDPLNLRLCQYIVRPGSACDRDSKAFAHQKLGTQPGMPDATNLHAKAILDLGLPTDNYYVSWARDKLSGKGISGHSMYKFIWNETGKRSPVEWI